MSKRTKRGRYAAVYLAGIAVIGGAAYAVTTHVTADDKGETRGFAPRVVTPAGTSGSASPAHSRTGGAQTGPVRTSPTPGSTISLGPEAMKRLNAAKKAGEHDVKVQRAMPQPFVTEPIQVREEGSVREKGKFLRVTSARQDLAGYRELGWIAGSGERVGSSSCTQTIRMSNEEKPRIRPTMLLCWRLSPERSVYTLMIDLKKKPSERESVARIDKTWAQMD